MWCKIYPLSSREKRLSGKDLIQPSLMQPGVVAARWAGCLHQGWPSLSAEVFLDPPKVSRQRQQWKITTNQWTYERCGSLSSCQGVGSVCSAQKSLEDIHVFLFSSLVFFFLDKNHFGPSWETLQDHQYWKKGSLLCRRKYLGSCKYSQLSSNHAELCKVHSGNKPSRNCFP